MSSSNQPTTQIGGTFRDRLAAAVAQLSSDTPYSIELVVQDVVWKDDYTRIFQDYRGDLSGRFLGAVAVALRQGMDVDREKANVILSLVLSEQRSDGSFGPAIPAMAKDHGAAWGHGRLLDDLLDSRDWVREEDAAALESAIARLTGYLIVSAPAWERWLRDTAGRKFLLDPLSMVRPLARQARTDSRAGEAARLLIAAAPQDNSGLHMHGYLLFLRGVLCIANDDRDATLLERVVHETAAVASRFLLPSGSTLESLSEPWDVNTEGCGTADWVMLNLELYRATDDADYLERGMNAGYNGLLHSQAPSGHFGCETLMEHGEILVRDYAPEAWWCCTFHGIEALGAIADTVALTVNGALSLEAPLSARVLDAAGKLALEVSGGYPFTETVTIVPGPAVAVETLRVRVPRSSTVRGISVEGTTARTVMDGEYLVLDNVLPGRRIEILLNNHVWFHVDGDVQVPPFGNTTAAAPDYSRSRTAAHWGALLLVASVLDNDPEDVLRSQRLVSPREQLSLESDGDCFLVEAIGYDSFATTLRLCPIGGPIERNARTVRASFGGFLFEKAVVHSLEH